MASIVFRKLVLSLGNHIDRPIGTIYDGMGQPVVESLLGVAEQEIRRLLDVKVRVRPLRFTTRKPSLAELWATLRSEIGRKQVAILGL